MIMLITDIIRNSMQSPLIIATLLPGMWHFTGGDKGWRRQRIVPSTCRHRQPLPCASTRSPRHTWRGRWTDGRAAMWWRRRWRGKRHLDGKGCSTSSCTGCASTTGGADARVGKRSAMSCIILVTKLDKNNMEDCKSAMSWAIRDGLLTAQEEGSADTSLLAC